MQISTVKTVFITLFAAGIVAFASACAAIYAGVYDVAASTPDNELVAWALHTTSDRAIAVRLGDIRTPAGFDKPELIKAGAKLYGDNCVVCHSGPGLLPSPAAKGMNPAPPDLFREGREAASEETFWFIKNGVKMSGMPSFGKTYADPEIWSVVAFLKIAPGMSPQAFTDYTGIDPAAVGMKKAGN